MIQNNCEAGLKSVGQIVHKQYPSKTVHKIRTLSLLYKMCFFLVECLYQVGNTPIKYIRKKYKKLYRFAVQNLINIQYQTLQARSKEIDGVLWSGITSVMQTVKVKNYLIA